MKVGDTVWILDHPPYKGTVRAIFEDEVVIQFIDKDVEIYPDTDSFHKGTVNGEEVWWRM